MLQAKDDGTGPAKTKPVKKEVEKKRVSESKDEKKTVDEKRKLSAVKPEVETKLEEKKGEPSCSFVFLLSDRLFGFGIFSISCSSDCYVGTSFY